MLQVQLAVRRCAEARAAYLGRFPIAARDVEDRTDPRDVHRRPAVQLALRHSSATITLDTDAHEWPDALDRSRALVDAALGRPGAATRELS